MSLPKTAFSDLYFRRGILPLLAIGFVGAISYGQTRSPDRPMVSPVKGWGQKFAQQKQLINSGSIDICFVGDSLTEYWTTTGDAVWQLEFRDLKVVNYGIAADRTEHILYRLTRSQFSRKNAPACFVIMAGTNNLSQAVPDTPNATFEAIVEMIKFLSLKCPQSQFFIMTLPPNGLDPESPLNRRIREFNTLTKNWDAPETVSVIDISPLVTDESGAWRKGYTIDGTHFTQRGYQLLADTLKKH